jgi:hypothetical protein
MLPDQEIKYACRTGLLPYHHCGIETQKELFSPEKDFSTLFFCDSAVIPFEVKMWKRGENSAFLCASVAVKSLINNMSAFSQAGRRQVDPGLPLQSAQRFMDVIGIVIL